MTDGLPGNYHSICRMTNDEKSKDFSIPYYIFGSFMGYLESDEHFRNRIKEILKNE